jgi:hypothetical protein
VIFYLLRIQAERWNQKNWATPTVMIVFLATYMIDSLLNAMINPVYMLFSGGIVSMLLKPEGEMSHENDGDSSEKALLALPTTRFIPSPSLQGSPRFIS